MARGSFVAPHLAAARQIETKAKMKQRRKWKYLKTYKIQQLSI